MNFHAASGCWHDDEMLDAQEHLVGIAQMGCPAAGHYDTTLVEPGVVAVDSVITFPASL